MIKKSIIILYFVVSILVLVSCNGLKTPEELIGPPEVDLEKKKMNDIVLSQLPQNAELLLLPKEKNDSNTEPLIKAKFDHDNQEEIAALFRDKSTRKIGLIVVGKNNDIWSKRFELKLDAYEISDYVIADVNNDGEYEIILGYFSVSDPYKELIILSSRNGIIEKIFESKYLALYVNEQNSKNEVQIAVSISGNEQNNNKVIILIYKNNMIQKIGEVIYPEDVEIYKISFGKINETTKTYFVDMYVNESTGRTDLLTFSNGDLYSLLKKYNIPETKQRIPMTSTDINDDGMMELISNEIAIQKDGIAELTWNKYFSINSNRELQLVSQDFVDINWEIKIAIPPIKGGSLFTEKNENELNIYYVSSQNASKTLFLKIAISADQTNYDIQGFEKVLERSNVKIYAKKIIENNLKGSDKNELDKLLQSMDELSNFIKYIDLRRIDENINS